MTASKRRLAVAAVAAGAGARDATSRVNGTFFLFYSIFYCTNAYFRLIYLRMTAGINARGFETNGDVRCGRDGRDKPGLETHRPGCVCFLLFVNTRLTMRTSKYFMISIVGICVYFIV
jgi:hypothetical protein